MTEQMQITRRPTPDTMEQVRKTALLLFMNSPIGANALGLALYLYWLYQSLR